MREKRLISILNILGSGRIVNAKDLASEFNVSNRTIYRDLDAMCEAGINLQITRGARGGIKSIDDIKEEDYSKIKSIVDKPIKHSGKIYVVKTDAEDSHIVYEANNIKSNKKVPYTSGEIETNTWLIRLLNEDNSDRVDLVVQIDQSMSFRVYDELDGYWERVDSGDLLVNIDVANTEWMYSYICSYCDKIKVISPVSVREEIRRRYAMAYRRYQ